MSDASIPEAHSDLNLQNLVPEQAFVCVMIHQRCRPKLQLALGLP
jgi:hypothetical protein